MSLRELFWGIINFNFGGVLSGFFLLTMLAVAAFVLFIFSFVLFCNRLRGVRCEEEVLRHS